MYIFLLISDKQMVMFFLNFNIFAVFLQEFPYTLFTCWPGEGALSLLNF